MAATAIDQRLLGRLAQDLGPSHPALSKNFYQLLGLSVALAEQLLMSHNAVELGFVNYLSVAPGNHSIIWLCREGLAITEHCILPFCHIPSESPRCLIMAVRLRASFYHILCLCHNQPKLPHPFHNLTMFQSLLKGLLSLGLDTDTNVSQGRAAWWPSPEPNSASRKGSVPSQGSSDDSFVTNPYANVEPIKALPHFSFPRLVSGSPGMIRTSPISALPVGDALLVSAEFILPSIDFSPLANSYFMHAKVLAEQFLPGWDPLRLAIAYESLVLTLICTMDYASVKTEAMAVIQAVYTAETVISSEASKDAALIVAALANLARHMDSLIRKSTVITSYHQREQSTSQHSRSTRALSSKESRMRPQKPRQQRIDGSPTVPATGSQDTCTTSDVFLKGAQTGDQETKERQRRRTLMAEELLGRLGVQTESGLGITFVGH